MKSLISIIALLFITFSANAQSFKTPDCINMSKNYLPFNAAKLDLDANVLTISIKFKTDIPHNITTIRVSELKGQKKYFIDTVDGVFICTIVGKEITELTAFAGKSVDWVLSK